MGIRKKPIKTSNMTLPVNIEQQADVEDDRGGVKKVWSVLWTDVFVELTSRHLTALDAGGQLVSVTKHIIRTRYIPGIVPGMRVNDYTYGRYFHITSADDPLGTGVELEIVGVEVIGKN